MAGRSFASSTWLAALALALLLLLAGGARAINEDTVRELPVRSHSLQQPYLDADLENRYWTFGGSTVVSTNKYVRLTPDRQSRRGWLWSKDKLESENWHVEFEFKIDGVGTRVFGDGLAFWFTTEKETQGQAFGNQAVFNGLGVFFDTYMNGKHPVAFPYVGVMVNDGTRAYSVDDDNFSNNNGGCEARIRKSSFPTRARVTYFARTLKVDLDLSGNSHWTTCATITDVTLPSSAYIGFTAATGDVADNHDIISVATTQYVLPNRPHLEALRQAAIPQEITRSKSDLKGVTARTQTPNAGYQALMWTLLVAVLLVVGLGVVYVIRKNAEKSSKRF